MERKRLVVVGNGLASMAFIEEAVRLNSGRYEIEVFGEERHIYNRVLLAQVLTGEKGLEDILLHGPEWFSEKGVRLHSGVRIERIDRRRKTVVAEGGVESRYDRLVIATGALPLVPGIPGADRQGVFTFRTMRDCAGIREAVREGAKAVVIGGGLLGIEAAWGLSAAGARVSIVHLMDRLMERQLDSVAAGFLKEELQDLGIEVLLNMETASIEGDGRVEAIAFNDGGRVDADLVVFSTGIRPNVRLARDSGIYCGRGIVVSDCMQTFDPAISALGECVEHRGATFGLVGPIMEQARVLANHLCGDSRLIYRTRPASTRLKVPGIDLYSAGEIGAPGDEAIEYIDKAERICKRVFIRNGVISGILMYGDTSDAPALFSMLCDGEDIGAKRRRLLSGGGRAEAPSSGEIPDDAMVCGCNGVTRRMIVEAIEKKGLFTRADVARETKASSSCGGCAATVDKILEGALGTDFKPSVSGGICACTQYTRSDIVRNIREKGLKSVREVMETLGWVTVGCETCRPAINYYASMVWPREAEDDGSSRAVNERLHANIQRDGTFSVVPRLYGGVVKPEELKAIAEAAERFAVPLIKITGGQRIGLMGVKREDLDAVWGFLGMPSGHAYGKAVRTVKTCVGKSFCRYGTQDALSVGIRLEKMLSGLWMPAKVKLGVSGCPRNCAEADIKDVGIYGVSGGWEIYAGGSGGIELKAAGLLASTSSEGEAVEIVCAFLQHYREEADYGERTCKWVERTGIKRIKEALNGARAELCRRLEEALSAAVKNPWLSRRGKEGRFCARSEGILN